MKQYFNLFLVALFSLVLFSACENDTSNEEPTASSFLSEIRPVFFDNTNFTSPGIVANIPNFMQELAESYDKLENEYKAGLYTEPRDLNNMKLVGQYYTFYMLAIVGNYMDENIQFSDIVGDRETGYYSKLPVTDPDIEQKEMDAMMARGQEVGLLAVNVNGYSDKAYGFYISVRQMQERVKNNNYYNSPIIHDSVVQYVNVQLEDYDNLPDWNVLMAMVGFTNYNDSLNTFYNPQMNDVLANVNARLVPGTLDDLGGRYPEILGPLYRFDLNLKKLDWYLQVNDEIAEEELVKVDEFITTLETSSNFIKEERSALLNSWPYKATFDERIEVMNDLKAYRESVATGTNNLPKPNLAPYLDSKNFKKAYQCYSCHKTAEL